MHSLIIKQEFVTQGLQYGYGLIILHSLLLYCKLSTCFYLGLGLLIVCLLF